MECTPPTMQKEKSRKKKGLGRRAPIVKQLVFFFEQSHCFVCGERTQIFKHQLLKEEKKIMRG